MIITELKLDKKEQIINNFHWYPYTKPVYFSIWEESTKNLYCKKINEIMRSLFSEYMFKNKILNIPGDNQVYSFLNFINTNQACVSIIVNYFNGKIYTAAKEGKSLYPRLLNFDTHPSKWNNELKILLKLIDIHKFELFKKGTFYLEREKRYQGMDIYSRLKEAVNCTRTAGEVTENILIDYIKNNFEHVTDICRGGNGKLMDFQGIDVLFLENGVEKTAQFKKCESVTYLNNQYIITGTNGTDSYTTNYMGFVDDIKNVYIFNNKDMSIVNDKTRCYIFPENQLKSIN